MNDGVNPMLICVASAGHSGSTLLDLLIASHPDVCSAGEMNRLTLHSAERVCACGATIDSCEYWTAVRRTLVGATNGKPVAWNDWHTDIPPQVPLLRVEQAFRDELLEGALLPDALRRRLAAGGVRIAADAVLTRGGVRDVKWRIIDKSNKREYVLRDVASGIDVYDGDVKWKNPVRKLPDPLEVALASGSRAATDVARRWSRSAREQFRVAENSWAVADAMARVSGARYVVDSSKSPVRLKLLYMLASNRVRIIHLVRDGRAVVASAMRRRDISAVMATRIWKRENRNIALMLRSVPSCQRVAVRYEDLCDDPVREIQRVCGFLDIGYRSEMLQWWTRPVHNIPGNPMLFNRAQRAITKDERWRQQLTEHDVTTFENIAGSFNRSLGYR